MTTALTVMQNAQLPAVVAQTTRAPLKSLRKIADAIREQWATTEEIERFVFHFGDVLVEHPKQKAVVDRAYARARYREGYDLTVTQLAQMSGMTTGQVRGHMIFLGYEGPRLNGNQCFRIMCRDQND